MQPFTMTADARSLSDASTRILEVPETLAGKDALLAWYARALEMPEYFGSNWDAFDECLRDLSWLKERRLVLYHRDIPLKSSPNDQRVYVDVLARAVEDWKSGEAHEVVAAFDPICELRLRALARDR